MPGRLKYRPQSAPEVPAPSATLPLDRAIAVYCRQSSRAQIGNISTDMQQIDLPRYVNSLGWNPNQIILIDEDEGISGVKRIDERKGMSRLFDLIISGRIGAIAVQAEDRLFRDETQIQVNLFVEACIEHDVHLITPYFHYNFTDGDEGHRSLFQMRADQAADFLTSYVQGRLVASKKRMLLQGRWMGGHINLGFMVDDRKYLSNGLPNPRWRKFTPFEPCAEVVVKIYELFIHYGGNTNAVLHHLYENGPHFPDFDDPKFRQAVPHGFICAKPMRMLKRNNVYVPSREALTLMLTNGIYLGHWIYHGTVVVWNNHAPIVDEELFYQAFNYLSPNLLTGEPNPNYSPRLGYRHDTRLKERPKPNSAIYLGLVGTFHEGQWRRATVAWRKRIQDYIYQCNYVDVTTTVKLLWARHVRHFDRVITEMLLAKLKSIPNSQSWVGTLGTIAKDFEAENRQLNYQLASITQIIQTLITNISRVTVPSLLQTLEQEYANHEQEKKRLEGKLTALEQHITQKNAMTDIVKQIDFVLSNWEQIDVDERRTVARVFIKQIIITPRGKHKVVDVEICWGDNTSDSFILPYRSDTWTLWTPPEIDLLKELLDHEASQVEMAAALPTRNWRAIRIKVYEIIGFRRFYISPKPIRDPETYLDYLARVERDGEKANRTSGNRWREDELQTLAEALDRGATQLEISAALPVRTWEAICKKIVQLRGPGPRVPENGHLKPGETFADYLARVR